MSSSPKEEAAPAGPIWESESQPHKYLPTPSTSTELEKEEELLRRELVLFGKDVGSVPCFRNSFLYGITGGFGTGIVHFAFSSKVPSATKFGFYSYVLITLGYWVGCRYNYALTKFRYTQLQYAVKESALREGTADQMPKC